MNTDPWGRVTTGARTGNIRAAQYMLRTRGWAIAADGLYGPATQGAIEQFQADAGLTPDGVVGPMTWPALVVQTQQGNTGDAVRAVQQYGLIAHPGDQPLAVDGDYGPATAQRVAAFQSGRGLVADGIAGAQTWSFLATDLTGPEWWPLVQVGQVQQGQTQQQNWRVLAAQHLLRAHGATIVADGVFGPASGTAVTAFQSTVRSDELGTTVGERDWPSLIITVKQGDTGDAVAAAQSLLEDVIVDGDFGPLTDQSVRSFQGVFAPPADGIVGLVTWHALTLPVFD